jgi:hypothetical protein
MMLKETPTKSLKTTEPTEKPCSFRRVINAVFRKDRKSKKSESLHFVTIGGVYFEAGESSESKPTSHKSLNSVDTESSSGSWNSSGASDHHKGAPRIAKNFSQRRINPNNIHLSEDEMVGRIMLNSRRLPKNDGYLVSNHVMINNERTRRAIAPLKRIPALDEIARAQANLMAEENQLFHSNPEELREELVGQDIGRRIGENVAKGTALRAIHKNMMTNSLADTNNLLDRRYTCMGVGTAKGSDGTLYICQIFRD